jgi:hypothetical protein
VLRKAEPLGQAANVCIDGQSIISSEVDADDAGGLASDAWQRLELGSRNGYLPPMFLN